MAEYKVVDAEKLDAELSSVADAIRTKGGTSESLEFPQGFVNAVGAIESGGGGTEEIENLIDQSGVLDSTEGTVEEKLGQLIIKANSHNVFQRKIVQFKDSRSSLFHSLQEEIPPFDFSMVSVFSNMFASTANVREININTDSANKMDYMFTMSTVETITITQTAKVSTFQEFVSYAKSLKTITNPLDFGNATTVQGAFYQCYALENISFVANSIKLSIAFGQSSLLSAESIQSIIDGLATVETAQTLTLHADVKAKLTQDQLATITSKNWNLA